jgi:hypothetical protein
MANKIQIRRDTAENWIIVNPLLVDGEPGLETNTGHFKFGDGIRNWNDLPYSNFEDSVYNDFNVNGGLFVTGDTNLSNTFTHSLTVNGDFILNGNTQYIISENSVYTDNLLEIHSPGGNIANNWTYNDGKDVGVRFHYYNGSDKNAALYMDNGDWILKWVVDGTEDVGGQFIHSGFGDFQANTVIANLISSTVISNGINLNSYLQSAYNQANTASSNTVYVQGVDITQNTRLNLVESVNATQNNNITTANTKAQAAFDKANTVGTLAQASFNKANTVGILTQAAFDKANTSTNTFSSLTVTGTALLNGLTQVQQLDMPYTAKTGATGTVTHDCSVGQYFYHTGISGNFTPNFTNLGLTSGYITEVKLFLLQGATARSITSMQIAGSAKTINWYNAINPTFTSNALDIVTFTILLTGTTYTVFGKVERYDSVAAGGGGGG